MHLRVLIGILGMLLPFICLCGSLLLHTKVHDSISMYYHSHMRDIFVGIMIFVSFFLISYKGYTLPDTLIYKITGIAGLCIALFPCKNIVYSRPVGAFLVNNSTSDYIHLIAAFIFFVLLAINSIFLFTKSDTRVLRGTKKYYRNILFRTSGYIIILALIVLLYAELIMRDSIRIKNKITLILEMIMLFSFGVSWLVKGGVMFKEEKLKS